MFSFFAKKKLLANPKFRVKPLKSMQINSFHLTEFNGIVQYCQKSLEGAVETM